MGLSSPGIGSGLDVNSLITKLMSVERQPITVLDTRSTTEQAKLTAYGVLSGTLSSLQQAVRPLTSELTYSGTKATVANSSLFSATSSSSAAPGDYTIKVETLAKAQKLNSAPFGSSSGIIGTGTLTFEFGAYSGGPPTTTFTANPDKVTKTVTIASGGDSLTSIAYAINSANIGVNATVINDGASYYLSISPNDPGVKNALRISVADDDTTDTDSSGLSQLAYNATTGGTTNMTEGVPAKDSKIWIDGVAVNKSLNVITDAIAGVTLNLTAESLTETTLNVRRDTSTIEGYVAALVTAYNTTSTSLASLMAYNATTGQAGILQSEGAVRAVQAQLRSTLSRSISGLTGGLSNLSEIGISFQRDGSLKFDGTKLQTALANPNKSVGALFVGTDSTKGFATRLNEMLDGMLSANGILTSRTEGMTQSLAALAKRKSLLESRMTSIEARYRKQYASLDTLVASMTKTSDYLTQQLATLPGVVSTTK